MSCHVHHLTCCQLSWTISVINLWRSSVTSLSHWPSTSVYKMVGVKHRVTPVCQWQRRLVCLSCNSTLKNIWCKMNIYDKWISVSVIKLMMQMRYRIFLTIKLLISHNVFLHGGGSSMPSSLFYIYDYLLLFTWYYKLVVHMYFFFVLSFVKKKQ